MVGFRIRSSRLALAAGFLMTSVLAAGCAEESTSGIDEARSDMQPLVDAACDWMFGCCTTDELVYQVGDFTVDADDCSDRIIDAISTGQPLDLVQGGLSDDPAEGLLILALSINEGRVDVDSGAVDECAAGTADRACNEPVEVVPGERCTPGEMADPVVDPCNPDEMFRGKQEVGEACDGPWECKEGLRCVDFGIAGICALRSDQGENCFSDAECADGLICDWESGTCSPGALEGETCAFLDEMNPVPGTESIRCANDLTCDPVGFTCVGGFCVAGAPCADVVQHLDCPEGTFCLDDPFGLTTCRTPGPAGTPCTSPDACQSNFCDLGLGVCADLAADGAPCGNGDECMSGFCDFNGGGVCSPTVGTGQPCNSFDDDECATGYCDTAAGMPTCEAYAGEGGACPTGIECDPEAELVCVDMSCRRPPFQNGVTCFDGTQCESGVCYMGECTDGLQIGSACANDGTTAPCVLGAFCESSDPIVPGSCAELRRPGMICDNSQQCWGECIVRFGGYMCDATPAFALGELWCDGP